jgi:hypothetical protein
LSRPTRHPFDDLDFRRADHRRLRELTMVMLRKHPDAGNPLVQSQAMVAARAQLAAEEVASNPKASTAQISAIVQVADIARRRVIGEVAA